MSLSQKHSGKVFVPWFNTAEWKNVHALLCSENSTNYKQAFDVLKIWKIRTPLLSAGIEGTLILLEAMLTETNDLLETQITQVYALSLLRFLNICAANSEKQGTFHKTVAKNDLPKWLIGIRHDIAHGNRLPSKSLLELALNSCLDWVKDKYWNVQKDIISDYAVHENEITQSNVIEILNIYVRLKLDLYYQNSVENDSNVIDQIHVLLSKKYSKKKLDVQNIIHILEESLKQYLTDPISRSMIWGYIIKGLINNQTLLNARIETDLEEKEVIAKEYRDMWSNLLNMLYENNFIGALLDELLQITNNIVLDHNTRKMASLWSREIVEGLQRVAVIKEELGDCQVDDKLEALIDNKYPEHKDCLKFKVSSNCLPSLQKFEEQVVNNPNKYSLNFISCLLKYNKKNENYVNDTVELVRKLTSVTITAQTEETYTIDSLPDLLTNEAQNKEPEGSPPTVTADVNIEQASTLQSSSKWTLVKDPLSYQNCPLGILPHQNRNVNPLLV